GQYFPYLADFGLAREVEAPGVTLSGATVGTPAYMAPEQVLGATRALDRRSDVYSLGASFYEVLVGKVPFDGGSAVGVLAQVLKDEPTAPRSINPALPVDLETIVMKAMEKSPARRYDSARAFGEDLQRYLDGDTIRARPPSLSYRLGKYARKH